MGSKNLDSWPEKIYLRVDDDSGELPDCDDVCDDDISWCSYPDLYCEIEYVRADLVEKLKDK